ncbi:GDP-mannose 3,5-epimerase 1 [Grifola frondosa]|uniref:GDP-mannose 3,5-epimerase 1 n=1 Tax=Grifola frondosa TaxID=5627 RepID=A0A1C7M689_GRIFR|nr:GDP-mannose 3,5-epimerase 1 [Grifola frondosa]
MESKYSAYNDNVKALEDERFLCVHDNTVDDGDVVLRSSNNTDFRVNKVILAAALRIFKNMFRTLQPITLWDGDLHPETRLPLVRSQEDYRMWNILLRMCYPFRKGDVLQLDDFPASLKAAQKYELEEISAQMRETLLAFVSAEPLQVLPIGCNMGWEREAKVAAQVAPYNIPANFSGFKRSGLGQITSGQLFQLVQWPMTSTRAGFEIAAPTLPDVKVSHISAHDLDIPTQSADIIIRSSDGIDIHAHTIVLSIASQKLARVLRESSRHVATAGLPVAVFPENSRVLWSLLRFCYPFIAPELDYCDVAEVLEAAKKYEVPRAIDLARKRWTKYVRAEPLRAYFVAFARGWVNEVKEAAKYAVFIPKDHYIPEMDRVSAEAYWRLLDYRRRSAAALAIALAPNDMTETTNACNRKMSSDAFDKVNGFNTYDRLEIGALLTLTTKAGLDHEAIIASIAQVVALQYHKPGNAYGGPIAIQLRADAQAVVSRIMVLQGRLDRELSKVSAPTSDPRVLPAPHDLMPRPSHRVDRHRSPSTSPPPPPPTNTTPEMKIAVTGCNGDVGTRVVAAARAQGHEVVGIDATPALAPTDKGYVFVQADLRAYDAALAALRGCDAVVHLAACRTPGDYVAETHNTNVVVSWNVLRAAAELGITRVAQASSVNVVALVWALQPDLDYLPLDEDHPCRPDEPYGLSKGQDMRVASRHTSAALPAHAHREPAPELGAPPARVRTPTGPCPPQERPLGYVQQDSAADAFLRAVDLADTRWAGHERFFIAAPDTSEDVESKVLWERFWSTIPIREGWLVGRRGFFDCAKAERLLGWVHRNPVE